MDPEVSAIVRAIRGVDRSVLVVYFGLLVVGILLYFALTDIAERLDRVAIATTLGRSPRVAVIQTVPADAQTEDETPAAQPPARRSRKAATT